MLVLLELCLDSPYFLVVPQMKEHCMHLALTTMAVWAAQMMRKRSCPQFWLISSPITLSSWSPVGILMLWLSLNTEMSTRGALGSMVRYRREMREEDRVRDRARLRESGKILIC